MSENFTGLNTVNLVLYFFYATENFPMIYSSGILVFFCPDQYCFHAKLTTRENVNVVRTATRFVDFFAYIEIFFFQN